jgi:hypothetical protein
VGIQPLGGAHQQIVLQDAQAAGLQGLAVPQAVIGDAHQGVGIKARPIAERQIVGQGRPARSGQFRRPGQIGGLVEQGAGLGGRVGSGADIGVEGEGRGGLAAKPVQGLFPPDPGGQDHQGPAGPFAPGEHARQPLAQPGQDEIGRGLRARLPEAAPALGRRRGCLQLDIATAAQPFSGLLARRGRTGV